MKRNNYKSQFERRIAEQFRLKRVKFLYEGLKLNFVQPEKKRTYKPDFILEANSLIIEAKGRLTREDRKKLLWVLEQYPQHRQHFRMLFQDSRKTLDKRSKTTYADWCTENGIKFADFRFGIPNEWLEERK